jgi:16S rRNA (adenine1518-N6/adenine1519-N6)-dimethyltransferase
MPLTSTANARKRRFGQNFLVDERAAAAILAAFRPAACDRVLEIGPGGGALTRRLVGRVERLRAVEIDGDLASRLERDLGLAAGGPAAVVRGDILAIDLAALLEELGAVPERPARVIANLPYNIATAVVLRLLGEAQRLSDILVMVQREVADRIAAAPGGRAYGGLSVLCQAAARIERVLRLGPGSFRPRPKVESQVIRLRPNDPPLEAPLRDALASVLRIAFAHRRKTLHNNLTSPLGRAAAVRLIADAGLRPGMRPEEVPVDRFLLLARLWQERHGAGRAGRL